MGLYGANASGKSNVLTALGFMRDAVIESHRFWSPDKGVPRDAFAWGPRKTDPSMFEATFLIDGVRYQYGFWVSDQSVTEEWLYAWPLGKKQVWLERDNGTFKFGDHLRGENKLIEEVTRPNALFLSAAAQHKHLQLQAIFQWFRSIRAMNISLGRLFRPGLAAFALAQLLEDSAVEARPRELFPNEVSTGAFLERFREMLKKADIGIVDLKITKIESDDVRGRSAPPRVQLKHQSEVEEAWLPLEEESRGTQMLFRLAMPILQVIQEGGILLVDELEASLHPSLAQEIVRQFNEPATNPRNSQLIFTTHDTNLLGTTVGPPALRRDQVWLTEKNTEGATVLYPLTDYKPRKAENLERGYLQGRYGAIPFLGGFSVAG